MHPEQKTAWLEHLDKTIQNRKKSVASLEAARNMADGKMQSRYDTQKENFALEAEIVQQILDREQALREEVAYAELKHSVEPGAFLDLYIDGVPEQYLFMNNQGELPDIRIITSQSPIGKALAGRIPGDKTTYSVGSHRFMVDIKSIL